MLNKRKLGIQQRASNNIISHRPLNVENKSFNPILEQKINKEHEPNYAL